MSLFQRPLGDEVADIYGPYFSINEINKLKVGDKLDALCQDGLNYHVEVREKADSHDHVLLHFIHWARKYDYRGPLKRLYLAPLGTYSTDSGITAQNNYTFLLEGKDKDKVKETTDKERRAISNTSSDSSATIIDEQAIVNVARPKQPIVTKYPDDYFDKPRSSSSTRRRSSGSPSIEPISSDSIPPLSTKTSLVEANDIELTKRPNAIAENGLNESMDDSESEQEGNDDSDGHGMSNANCLEVSDEISPKYSLRQNPRKAKVYSDDEVEVAVKRLTHKKTSSSSTPAKEDEIEIADTNISAIHDILHGETLTTMSKRGLTSTDSAVENSLVQRDEPPAKIPKLKAVGGKSIPKVKPLQDTHDIKINDESDAMEADTDMQNNFQTKIPRSKEELESRRKTRYPFLYQSTGSQGVPSQPVSIQTLESFKKSLDLDTSLGGTQRAIKLMTLFPDLPVALAESANRSLCEAQARSLWDDIDKRSGLISEKSPSGGKKLRSAPAGLSDESPELIMSLSTGQWLDLLNARRQLDELLRHFLSYGGQINESIDTSDV